MVDGSHQHVQRGMMAHDRVATLPIQGAVHVPARGRDRALEDVPDRVSVPLRIDDPRFAARPAQPSHVRGLTASARVEHRAVLPDGLTGLSDDRRVDLAQEVVRQMQ